MNTNTTKRVKSRKGAQTGTQAGVMSQFELAKLGGGHVAYIKTLTSDEAQRMFPAVQELPSGINLYALHAADGTPIALTDTKQAALSHAMDGELLIASIH
ncbi:MAG: DUF1150 domain-containing protein [Hyphomicrobium sp.]